MEEYQSLALMAVLNVDGRIERGVPRYRPVLKVCVLPRRYHAQLVLS